MDSRIVVHLFLASLQRVLAGEGTVSLFLGNIPLMALILPYATRGFIFCDMAQHHATLCAMMKDTREQLIDREARRVAIKALGGVKDGGVAYDAAKAQEEAKVAEGEEWARSMSGFVQELTGQKIDDVSYVGFSTGRRTFKLICS